MKGALTVEQLRAKVAGMIGPVRGSQRLVADKLGVTEQRLSDILAGRRNPDYHVADYFGLEQITVYIPKQLTSSRDAGR